MNVNWCLGSGSLMPLTMDNTDCQSIIVMQSVISKVETYSNRTRICYTSEGIHFSLQPTIPMQSAVSKEEPYCNRTRTHIFEWSGIRIGNPQSYCNPCNPRYQNCVPMVLEQEQGTMVHWYNVYWYLQWYWTEQIRPINMINARGVGDWLLSCIKGPLSCSLTIGMHFWYRGLHWDCGGIMDCGKN